MMWTVAMVLGAMGSPLAAQCETLAAPRDLGVDVTAKTSLDALTGPAPLNLVVLRSHLAGFATVTLDNRDDEEPAREVPNSARAFGQVFEAGPLTAGGRYALTISDPTLGVDSPDAPRRAIDFVAGDAIDVEPPTIEGTIQGVQEKLNGGLRPGSCSPLPYWGGDEYVTTVEVPVASDDVGIAGFELRQTVDGLETVADLEIPGAGDNQLVAFTFSAAPERLRVVALDHAGNASTAVEVQLTEDGGCAQVRGSHVASAALLLLVLARRRRRFVRRGL